METSLKTSLIAIALTQVPLLQRQNTIIILGNIHKIETSTRQEIVGGRYPIGIWMLSFLAILYLKALRGEDLAKKFSTRKVIKKSLINYLMQEKVLNLMA